MSEEVRFFIGGVPADDLDQETGEWKEGRLEYNKRNNEAFAGYIGPDENVVDRAIPAVQPVVAEVEPEAEVVAEPEVEVLPGDAEDVPVAPVEEVVEEEGAPAQKKRGR